MNATTGEAEPLDLSLSSRRLPSWWPIWVVILIAFALLGWRVVKSGTSADRSASSAAHSAKAVGDLASILNRRAPTLEYLACHDRASDQLSIAEAVFLVAQADYVQALVAVGAQRPHPSKEALVRVVRTAADLDQAKDRLSFAEQVTAATTDPNAPLAVPGQKLRPHRCPALPLPGGSN